MAKLFNLATNTVGFVRPLDLRHLSCDDAHLVGAVRMWLMGESLEQVSISLNLGNSRGVVSELTKTSGWVFIAQALKDEVRATSRSVVSRLMSSALERLQERVEKGDPVVITVSDAEGNMVSDTVYKPIRAKELADIAVKAKMIEKEIDERIDGLSKQGDDEHLRELSDFLEDYAKRKLRKLKGEVIDITPKEADSPADRDASAVEAR